MSQIIDTIAEKKLKISDLSYQYSHLLETRNSLTYKIKSSKALVPKYAEKVKVQNDHSEQYEKELKDALAKRKATEMAYNEIIKTDKPIKDHWNAYQEAITDVDNQRRWLNDEWKTYDTYNQNLKNLNNSITECESQFAICVKQIGEIEIQMKLLKSEVEQMVLEFNSLKL